VRFLPRRRTAEPERRGAQFDLQPLSEVFGAQWPSAALAPRVSRAEALSVPAVLRARNLIAGTIGSLPLTMHSPRREATDWTLFAQPEVDVPRSVSVTRLVEDLVFDGIGWWRVEKFGWHGYPVQVRRLDPCTVTVQPDGRVMVEGRYVPDSDLVRFDSPNPPLLTTAARAIRTCLTLETAASRYAASPQPTGMFTPADGVDPADPADVQAVLDAWEDARAKGGATAFVGAALKFQALQWSAEDLQLNEARQHAVLEIARATGLDPEDLGVSTTSRTYQNAESRRLDLLDFVLGPWVSAIQDRLSMSDCAMRGYYAKFAFAGLLRSDTQSRYDAYAAGLACGALAPEEIRDLEDRPPLPTPRPADPELSLRTRPGGVPGVTQHADPVAAEFTGVRSGSAKFNAAVMTFDADASAHFSADTDARTVTGLVVPWGEVGRSGGAQYAFTPGSLKYADVHRVKLLRDHVATQAIGKAVKTWSTPEGQWATFKIAKTPDGDQALALAADGVVDGFSIGVDFAEDGVTPGEDGVRHITRAAWRETSLVALPAYDSARTTTVTASAATESEHDTNEGNPMTVGTPEQPAATPDLTTFTATLTDSIAGAFTGALERLNTPTREVVSAGRAVVTEAPLYRFDGGRSDADFSTDLIAGCKGDRTAMARVEDFMSATFAVTTTGTAALNPARARPDLYVDQLDYSTPLFDAISKGALDSVTPVVLPKFNTSSGLVGPHTEGVEPTPGALTETMQTITPSPVSGKVEITREAWDQGGNPQLSTILWRQMTRAYAEGLEQAAVAMLDALSPTQITITAGSTDQVLEGQLTAALAGLQYIRGGYRFRDFFVQADLYKALIAATDADGRKLFPVLAPSNATGTTDPFFASVMVGGLAARPSWALAASGTTPASSYLLNREDVHGWATAPQRLQFESRVAFVDVGIWGYVAVACTRLDGVREVVYDPTA
jgi:HK97 family phage prohead protease